MKLPVVIISLLFSITAVGQSGFKFHSRNYIGLVNGESLSGFQVQTINGFQKGTWFGGVGTGLDFYFYRTVPLFLSFTKFLTARDRSFYFSVDGGTNFVWDNNTANSINGRRSDGDFTPSLYYGASAGYKIGLKNKRDAILLNIGYSAKYVEEAIKTMTFCINPPCPEFDDKYHYRFNRLSLKVGWMF
jgi:hypothetical protein